MMMSKTLRGQTLGSIGALAGMAAVRVFRGATGKQSFSEVSPSWLTALNDRAAEQNNQIP